MDVYTILSNYQSSLLVDEPWEFQLQDSETLLFNKCNSNLQWLSNFHKSFFVGLLSC